MIKLDKVVKSYKIDEETVFYALKESSITIKEKRICFDHWAFGIR